jgi:hypothetical protein
MDARPFNTAAAFCSRPVARPFLRRSRPASPQGRGTAPDGPPAGRSREAIAVVLGPNQSHDFLAHLVAAGSASKGVSPSRTASGATRKSRVVLSPALRLPPRRMGSLWSLAPHPDVPSMLTATLGGIVHAAWEVTNYLHDNCRSRLSAINSSRGWLVTWMLGILQISELAVDRAAQVDRNVEPEEMRPA